MLVESAEWQREDERIARINLVRMLEEMEKIHEDDVVLESHDHKSPVVNIDQSVFYVLSEHIAIDLIHCPLLSLRMFLKISCQESCLCCWTGSRVWWGILELL